jgi:hypothetical protein
MLIELILAAALVTQAPAEPPKQATPAPLSQVETMALEILELRAQLAETTRQLDQTRVELAQLRAPANTAVLREQASKLKSALELTRPGFVWDYGKRAFVPAPPKPAAKAPTPAPPVEK